jgi:hypothetical protein
MTLQLPDAFSALHPFVDRWALATENERSRVRWASSPEHYRAFYEAALPLMPAILAHLDQYQINALPEPEQRLFWLALAFAEASPHVEMYKGAAQVPNSFDASRFLAAHGDQPD